MFPSPGPRWLSVALLLLAGCGSAGQGITPATAPQGASGDMIHQAWVDAVRAGDHAAAQALIDPALPDPALIAHDAVTRMQDYLTNAASPTGALQAVTLLPVAGDVGLSVWQFAKKRWCYRTTLVQRDARWYVQRWGQTSQCPA